MSAYQFTNPRRSWTVDRDLKRWCLEKDAERFPFWNIQDFSEWLCTTEEGQKIQAAIVDAELIRIQANIRGVLAKLPVKPKRSLFRRIDDYVMGRR